MEPSTQETAPLLFTAPALDALSPLPTEFRCQIGRDPLLPALALMQAIAESHPALPILSHVYLEARAPDTLALRATDLEIGLSRHCAATVQRAGACTADARRLYDLVRALPPGSLTLESSRTHGLTISQGTRRFRLFSLDPSEFPQLAPVEDSVQMIELPATHLKELLDRTSFAVCADESRVHLHGLLFVCGPQEHVRCAGSDGHRLALIERPVPGLAVDGATMLLPYKGCTEMRRLLEDVTDDMVTMRFGTSIVVLTVGSTTLSVRLVEGQFPDYEHVIPRTHTHRIAMARRELIAALRRVMVLTTERARGVKCDFHTGTLILSVNTPDLGEAHEELPIDYQGDELSVGFNGRYLLDFCTAVEPAEQIVMELVSDTAPALLRVEGDSQYRYVVMPMRLC